MAKAAAFVVAVVVLVLRWEVVVHVLSVVAVVLLEVVVVHRLVDLRLPPQIDMSGDSSSASLAVELHCHFHWLWSCV